MANTVVTGTADVFTSGSITMGEIFAFLDTEPVGTVKESILSQAQFQDRAGDGWILANGASLSTSAYPELFAAIGYTYGGAGANFNIPNMQNRYTRMSGSSPVGTLQSQATKKNGLSISGGDFYLSGGTPSGGVNFLSTSHCHVNNGYIFPLTFEGTKTFRGNSPNTFFSGYCQLRFRSTLSCDSYASGCSTVKRGLSVCGSLNNPQGTNSASIYYNAPGLSSSSETRPSTIIVNCFVRVK